MHKGRQTNHQMYMHMEEILHFKIQSQKTQQYQILSRSCELNWMLEDAIASINYSKITKQFYWKDISNKVVRMRHMLRFPYLPASIFHSISVATMSENEGVNHSVHTQNFVLLKSQRETGPVNGILYDGQHLYLQQRKLFA